MGSWAEVEREGPEPVARVHRIFDSRRHGAEKATEAPDRSRAGAIASSPLGHTRPVNRLVYVGGPTVLIDLGGARFLTDPAFDPPGVYPAMGRAAGSGCRGPVW